MNRGALQRIIIHNKIIGNILRVATVRCAGDHLCYCRLIAVLVTSFADQSVVDSTSAEHGLFSRQRYTVGTGLWARDRRKRALRSRPTALQFDRASDGFARWFETKLGWRMHLHRGCRNPRVSTSKIDSCMRILLVRWKRTWRADNNGNSNRTLKHVLVRTDCSLSAAALHSPLDEQPAITARAK